MLDIVIIGAGGFGREVYHWAKASFSSDEYRFKGFLSNNPSDLDGFAIEGRVIGDPASYEVQENERFLVAIGDPRLKKKLVAPLRAQGARFLTLVHPSAVVVETATLGEGCVICPFALVSDHVVLEEFVMLNVYATCGHDARVGRYSVLSPYAALNGFAILEDEVFLGTHAAVAANRRIGKGSRISANSVAMYSAEEETFVLGVPGRNARTKFR